MKSEAGDGTGEGSTGTTSVLAMGFPGDAGAGSKGVQAGDEGADGARQLWDILCIGASCTGSGSG